jgi:hypothetical protein
MQKLGWVGGSIIAGEWSFYEGKGGDEGEDGSRGLVVLRFGGLRSVALPYMPGPGIGARMLESLCVGADTEFLDRVSATARCGQRLGAPGWRPFWSARPKRGFKGASDAPVEML